MGSVEKAQASRVDSSANISIRLVEDHQWEIVAWLWQLFRHDLAIILNALPYADGRYQTAQLRPFPSPDGAGYIAWRPHPKTGEEAPIGFTLVDGITRDRRSLAAFWVTPIVRRTGIGRMLALDVLARHEAPWTIVFQHDNIGAGVFWRGVADSAFGPGRWSEEQRPVPGLPDAPPDHWIMSR